MTKLYQYFFLAILPLLILIKGYFLSVEFSLYPFLSSQGFLPYKNIYDQHFPSLFFGFFALPFWLVNHPYKLLSLLLALVTASSLFLYLALKKQKTKNPIKWLVLFSLVNFYFAANTLWVETFVTALTALVLFLNTVPNKKYAYLSGLVISQAVLMRPTTFIFWLIFFLLFSKNKNKIFTGAIIGFLLSFFYLYQNSLLQSFYENVFIFNKEVYSNVQSFIPGLRQVLTPLAMVALFVYTLAKQQKKNLLILGLSSLLLLYPRFGLEHFQLFGLIFIYALARSKTKLNFLFSVLILLIAGQILGGLLKVRYQNYFYSPSLFKDVAVVKSIPEKDVYLFGASDLLYQLTNKTPPNTFYIPSLPWYLNYPPYQEKLLNSLTQSSAPVVVDTQFRVDDSLLIDTVPNVYKYIKMNYSLDSVYGNLEIYKKR